jgi:alpha-ketoglutarate-dependent taurine dioxygenase
VTTAGELAPVRAGRYLGGAGLAGRRALLSAAEPLPPPEWLTATAAEAASAGSALAAMVTSADRDGASAVRLDRPLRPAEFLAVGERLGRPIPEGAGAVQRFVRERFILDLVVEFGVTEDVDRQPFSRSPILIHSEGSRRTLPGQPRYLVFNCVSPSQGASGGQTVVVRNDDVLGRLPARCREVLAQVRYAGEGGAPILRWEQSRPVLCFRDFGAAPLDWETDQPLPSATVSHALDALLSAIYDPRLLRGLTWTGHELVLLDNRRLLHGRTAIPGHEGGAARRHLQRLRLLPPADGR